MGNTNNASSNLTQYQNMKRTAKRSISISIENPAKFEKMDNSEMIQLMKNFGKLTRDTRFNPKEIIFLHQQFKSMTAGANKLTFHRLCMIREFIEKYKILSKRIFNLFVDDYTEESFEIENNKEVGIKFETFLKTCSTFSRGGLEEQLPYLFRAMKDGESNYVTKKSSINFAKLVKTSFQSKNKSRSGEILGEAFETIDLVKEIEKNLFDTSTKLDERQFIMKALSTPSALYCLAILERFFHPVIIKMEKEMETNLNTLSLRYIVRLEKKKVPSSINLVCEAIEKKYQDYEKERLLLELCAKHDNRLVEAVLTSFGLGFTKEIDLGELGIMCLLHLLKSVLSNFPSPLFTTLIGKKYCDIVSRENLHEVCVNLLKDIPQDNFNTTRRVLSCLHFCSFNERLILKTYAKFYCKSFVRLHNDQNPVKNSEKIIFYMIANFKKIPELDKAIEKNINNEKESLMNKKPRGNPRTLSNVENFSAFSLPYSDFRVKMDKQSQPWPLILQFVIPFLPFKDLLKCRGVCRIWNNLTSLSRFWYPFLHVDFHVYLNWMNVPEKKIIAKKYKWVKEKHEFNARKIYPKFLFPSPTPNVLRNPNENRFLNPQHKPLKIGVYGHKNSGSHSFVACVGSFVEINDIRETHIGTTIEASGQLLDGPVFGLKVTHFNDDFLFHKDKVSKFYDCVIFVHSLENDNTDHSSFFKLVNFFREHISRTESKCKVFTIANKLDKFTSGYKPFFPLQENTSSYSPLNSFPVSVLHGINIDYFYYFIFNDLLNIGGKFDFQLKFK
eukprot:TRINITY_DN3102_c0_g1_i1.p1 TRINITY_DN3102_c0_g1~~TRINITY_DN3102_c0_g1_i1.p1  ORF type:complete len:783 (+),score=195.20 TRINITY_DN3102_c0_g1_i1:41-2389(+)